MSTAIVADASETHARLDGDLNDGHLDLLLQRVGQGDRVALRRVYDLCAPRLFAILSRLVVRRELAEDLLRDVFVAVWQEAWQFDVTKGSATAWLVSLARRKCILAFKSEKLPAPSARSVRSRVRVGPAVS